jgi:hypothetical protein
MTDRDPRCVSVCQEMRFAVSLADLLTNKGYPAEVVPVGKIGEIGDSLGFSDSPEAVLEVRVIKAEHAEPAQQFLADHADELKRARAEGERRAARTGTVTAVCEECGKSSEWPAKAMGTTEVCPHCHRYMDVPDPEDDWSEVDVGEGEEAAEDEAAVDEKEE